MNMPPDSPRISTELLDTLITGRVEPHIYAFTTETVPNYLKVGDTYRPVGVRLAEWKEIFPKLQLEYTRSARIDHNTIFRDHSVHRFLEDKKGLHRLRPTDKYAEHYYSKEFFEGATPEHIDEAIDDILLSAKNNDGRYTLYSSDHLPKVFHYTRGAALTPRKNQQEVIDNFKNARAAGRKNLLMYAVMRFGKSFTSMCCAKEMDASLVLVVSAKADVKEEWKQTVEANGNFEGYVFAEKKDLAGSHTFLKEARLRGEKVVLFLTLQDLQGDEMKDAHREVFTSSWDLLLVDETHFGARAEHYGRILLTKKEATAEHTRQMKDVDTLDDLDNVVKELTTDITIHLSGTPYRILMGSEFEKDDIIAFVQFSDIAEARDRWIEEHKFDEDAQEWDNPYFGFPQMIRFAFRPNEASLRRLEELKAQGATTSFSELFRPQSIAGSAEGMDKFVHEDVVLEFLRVIDGVKADSNVLGFLDNERIRDGKLCRHIVIVLPYCASCDAMERLIKYKRAEFRNLSDYEIVNISGVHRDRRFADTSSVKRHIAGCEANGKRTITLTVNRMLTGSTVPQWDTMLFLRQSSSPEEYDQAVYRLQNPYIEKYEGDDGTVRFNMKPQTILVDFDPERVFRLQERKSQIYNVNTDNNGNSRLRERIETELRISPVITLDHNKLREVTAAVILDAVRDYANTRSVVDEATDMPVDTSLLNNPELRQVIESLKPINSKKGIIIPAVDDDDDEGDDIDPTASDEPTSPTSPRTTQESEDKEDDNITKKFAAYFALILFFSFLTDDTVGSLEDIISVMRRSEDNRRLSRNLGLDRQILQLIQTNCNGFILSRLDYKIQNTNSLNRDNSRTPLERAALAMKKFGRMSESEIVTPIHIATNVVGMLPDDILEYGPVVDIASKQAEFAVALLGRYGAAAVNNIYSICTSPLAYEFTRKVYRLLSLPIGNIYESFTSYDLIKKNNPHTTAILQELKNMKFSAVVGNPPYQEMISSGESNRSLAKQHFPHFVMTSIELGSPYTAMITPSRWFTADAQDKSFVKLRQFAAANNHFERIINFPNPGLVFDGVLISGGVNFFLYNREHRGDVNFVEVYEDKRFENTRPLFEPGMDVIFSSSRNFDYVTKVTARDFTSLTTITQGRNAFGLVGKGIEGITSAQPFEGAYAVRCRYEEIRFIAPDAISKNKTIADKWKVFISKGNGGAGLLTDNKQVAILGVPYMASPKSVCTDSLIPIGCFDTEFEAMALWKYLQTRFVRFLVGILKTSQNLYQPVYQFVPLQNFTPDSDIRWMESVAEIDAQLYAKYELTKDEISFIESMIKPM